MSKNSETIRIRFNGEKFDKHLIDVNELAPALLSIADICTVANNVLNDDKAALKVLVKANIEQHCFEIGIKVVQSLYSQLRLIIGNSDVKDVKEILEWVGIIHGVGIGGTWSFFKFFKWLGKRKIESAEISKIDGKNVVILKVEGNNNAVTINQNVYDIYRSKKAFEATKKLAKCIEKEGCESLAFEYQDQVEIAMTRDDATQIAQAVYLEDIEEEKIQIVEGHIYPHTVTMASDSKKWKFIYNDKPENIDISESDIAKIMIGQRGKIVVGDCFRVKMEMIEKRTSEGFKNHYKVIEILKFIPGKEQNSLDV